MGAISRLLLEHAPVLSRIDFGKGMINFIQDFKSFIETGLIAISFSQIISLAQWFFSVFSLCAFALNFCYFPNSEF